MLIPIRISFVRVACPEAIQKLRLLFTEREKIVKTLSSFENSTENKEFMPKEVSDLLTWHKSHCRNFEV